VSKFATTLVFQLLIFATCDLSVMPASEKKCCSCVVIFHKIAASRCQTPAFLHAAWVLWTDHERGWLDRFGEREYAELHYIGTKIIIEIDCVRQVRRIFNVVLKPLSCLRPTTVTTSDSVVFLA